MHRNLHIYIAIGCPLWDTVPNRQSSDHGTVCGMGLPL